MSYDERTNDTLKVPQNRRRVDSELLLEKPCKCSHRLLNGLTKRVPLNDTVDEVVVRQ